MSIKHNQPYGQQEYAGKEELESPAGIEDIISEKMKGRDRIDEALSVLVLEHYSDFVSGMANVRRLSAWRAFSAH